MTTKVHLDTDLGGDIDDLCALAMLLRWEDVEITGITTVAEANGRRAGYVRHVLELEGRTGIPVAAGANVSQGYYRYPELGYPDEERYWSKSVHPSPNPLDAALQLLKESIEQSAIQVAIRPEYQGQGLSTQVVQPMRALVHSKGFSPLVAKHSDQIIKIL